MKGMEKVLNLLEQTAYSGKIPYEKWRDSEGIPVIKEFYIEDLRTVPLAPWERKGGLGTYLQLEGTEGTCDGYVCEIPPGKGLKSQRHLYEETIYILKGVGATTIWNEGGPQHTFEWKEGSLFAIPLNAWHQHFNGQGNSPVRYVAVTTAPPMINQLMNVDFIFNNPFVFSDRYQGQDNYFNGEGASHPGRIFDTNFVSDVRNYQLLAQERRGKGARNVMFQLANSSMGTHVSEFEVGTYKKAHRHQAGANIIILSGQGYSLVWPEGKPWKRIDWKPGSFFGPPNQWYHQHFNTGNEPTRYMAIKTYGQKFRPYSDGDYIEKKDRKQIEYEDEDPKVRELYIEECRKNGVTV
jgi:quercetin dioxygenase-like cupin family protein